MATTLVAPSTMSPTFVTAVHRVAPDLEVVLVGNDGPIPNAAAEAQILYRSNEFRRDRVEALLDRARSLRWVHIPFAGVDGMLSPVFQERNIAVTHAVGLYDVPVAELALALILSTAKRLPLFAAAQHEGRWLGVQSWDNASALPHVPAMIRDQTVGIVGLGGIGGELAARLQPLGCRVLGMRRSGQPDPRADAMFGPEGLPELLAESDYVVLAVPLTDRTRALIGEPEIAAMKRTAWLVNVGRGALIDDDALIAALQEQRIGGACLDVFRREPLPAEHPYYGLPNVVLTPHVAGLFPGRTRAEIDLFVDELRRFLRGEPFRGSVNLAQGY